MMCEFCSATLDDDSFFCDQCGQEIKVCEQCGKTGKGKRCTQDGKPMVSKRELQAQAKTNHQNVTSPPSTQVKPPVPQEEPRVANEALGPKSSEIPTLSLSNGTLKIELTITSNVTIGRTSGDFVSVFGAHNTVSGRHASISHDGVWKVTDLGSSNGTYINDQRIPPQVPTIIEHRARLRFAQVELLVTLPPLVQPGTVRL